MNATTEKSAGLELMPEMLQVGRRLFSGHHWAGMGTIVAVHGTPDASSCRSLGGGVVQMGGRADIDVCYDNGRRSHLVPESIARSGYEFKSEIVGPEAVAAAVARCEEFAAAEVLAKVEAEKALEAKRAAVASSPEFAHLERRRPGGLSDHALAAKNIRSELRRRFPGIKFSVTSESYAGGNAARVAWDLGPTEEEIKEITSRHEEGSFNGMEDIYEYRKDCVFSDLFGGAKYITENRHTGEAFYVIAKALCQLRGVAVPESGNFWMIPEHGNEIDHDAREIIGRTSFPAGAVVTGAEWRGEPGEEKLCAVFTAPAAQAVPAAESVPVVSGGTALVVLNAEKNGIEIRFPSKPAAAVLDEIKAAGWRWSRFAGCWYTKDTPAAREFAARVTS